MDLNELRELIQLLESSGLSEVEIEENGRRVRLSKMQPQAPVQAIAPVMVPQAVQSFVPPPVLHAHSATRPEESAQEPLDAGLVTIDSPMVGTYFGTPAPDQPPFVQVGDLVEVNQTVCIIEAMKIMNEVTSKISGVVEKLLVDNGEPVEYGQPLIAVRPQA